MKTRIASLVLLPLLASAAVAGATLFRAPVQQKLRGSSRHYARHIVGRLCGWAHNPPFVLLDRFVAEGAKRHMASGGPGCEGHITDERYIFVLSYS